MSFGSLNKNAVMAMNNGAKKGEFYHNTGEGGVSPYHLQGGICVGKLGRVILDVDNKDGIFSDTNFVENVTKPEVKLIEVKFSQGAKSGHGSVDTMDEIINHWNIKKKVIDKIPVTANLGNGNF